MLNILYGIIIFLLSFLILIYAFEYYIIVSYRTRNVNIKGEITMGYSARRGFTNGKASGAARQAELQQKIAQMQEQMNATQEAVEAQEFTASVGGGVVEARVNGKKEVLSINIKPEAVDPEDVEMLQDLVVSAVNEALRQAGDAMEQGMAGVTGNLNLGAFGL